MAAITHPRLTALLALLGVLCACAWCTGTARADVLSNAFTDCQQAPAVGALCWVWDDSEGVYREVEYAGQNGSWGFTGDTASEGDVAAQLGSDYTGVGTTEYKSAYVPPEDFDLAEVAGEGGSIDEWMNKYDGAGSSSCDAVCSGIGDQLASTEAQSGVGDVASAVGEASLLADTEAGSGFFAAALGIAPELVGAAAAGYAAFKIGQQIFGSPSTADSPGAVSFIPLYPVTYVTVEAFPCPLTSAGAPVAGCQDDNNVTQGVADPATATFSVIGSGHCQNEGVCLSDGWVLGKTKRWGGFAVPDSMNGATPQTAASNVPAGGMGGQWLTLASPYQTGVDDFVMPSHWTPEPSTFIPTGSPTIPSAPAPAPVTSGKTLTTINNAPAKYPHLLRVMVTVEHQVKPPPGSAGLGGGTATGQPAPGTGQFTVPQIQPSELTSTYVQQLDTLGATNVVVNILTGDQVDLELGPYAAVAVEPLAGTTVDDGTLIEVKGNPGDVPAAGSGPTSPVGPNEPGIKLPSLSTPCTSFPFGVPCWLVNQLQTVQTAATAPDIRVGMPAAVAGPGGVLDINFDHPFGFDLTGFMGILRPILLVLSFLGIVWWLASLSMGGGGGGGPAESDD